MFKERTHREHVFVGVLFLLIMAAATAFIYYSANKAEDPAYRAWLRYEKNAGIVYPEDMQECMAACGEEKSLRYAVAKAKDVTCVCVDTSGSNSYIKLKRE